MSERISLCMIVRNEADTIERCLRSAAPAVDELIVVDTGSTDDTVRIARRYGAVVFSAEWEDDFAAARNVGLERATGDWILVLDADEELAEDAPERLRACVRDRSCSGYYVTIYNYFHPFSEDAAVHSSIRLFRNDPRHRFEGAIHEQIAPSILRRDPRAVFGGSDIVVRHYGYVGDVVADRRKVERNMRILRRQLRKTPGDPFHLYNMGVEWARAGRPERAVRYFRAARSRATCDAPFVALAYKYEAFCWRKMGDVEKAVFSCLEGIKRFPSYTDLFHYAGLWEMEAGRWENAESFLTSAYRLGPPPAPFQTETGIGAHKTCFSLGILAECRRDDIGVLRWHLEAVRLDTSAEPPLCRLFRYMHCADREKQLAAALLKHFRPDQAGKQRVLNLLEACGCFRTARLLSRIWGIGRSKSVPRLRRDNPAGEEASRVLNDWHVSASRDTSSRRRWVRAASRMVDARLLDVRSPEFRAIVRTVRLLLPWVDGFV